MGNKLYFCLIACFLMCFCGGNIDQYERHHKNKLNRITQLEQEVENLKKQSGQEAVLENPELVNGLVSGIENLAARMRALEEAWEKLGKLLSEKLRKQGE